MEHSANFHIISIGVYSLCKTNTTLPFYASVYITCFLYIFEYFAHLRKNAFSHTAVWVSFKDKLSNSLIFFKSSLVFSKGIRALQVAQASKRSSSAGKLLKVYLIGSVWYHEIIKAYIYTHDVTLLQLNVIGKIGIKSILRDWFRWQCVFRYLQRWSWSMAVIDSIVA